jgi:hypothetical protein
MMVGGSARPDYRLFLGIGLSDVAVGIGLAVAGLTGLLGENGSVIALAGGGFAVVGVAVVIWARNKLSQDSGPGGDRN